MWHCSVNRVKTAVLWKKSEFTPKRRKSQKE
jgi:hypothetical protein